MEKYAPKNYKKHTAVLLLVAATALVVCAVSFALKRNAAVAVQGNPEQTYVSYYSPKPSASQENRNSENSSAESIGKREGSAAEPGKSTEAEKESYLITVYNGKIGVYRDGEVSPFLTADVDVYLLPQEDVAILKKGIRAESFSEVKGVLEDYE